MIAEPHRVKGKPSLWGISTEKLQSSVQVEPPVMGCCGVRRAWGVFAEQLPKDICS